MTIRENKPLREDGRINLDDRNYITLGMTYDEFLDLRSLIEDVLRHSTKDPITNNRWVNLLLLVERDTRLAVNLLKRLNQIK